MSNEQRRHRPPLTLARAFRVTRNSFHVTHLTFLAFQPAQKSHVSSVHGARSKCSEHKWERWRHTTRFSVLRQPRTVPEGGKLNFSFRFDAFGRPPLIPAPAPVVHHSFLFRFRFSSPVNAVRVQRSAAYLQCIACVHPFDASINARKHVLCCCCRCQSVCRRMSSFACNHLVGFPRLDKYDLPSHQYDVTLHNLTTHTRTHNACATVVWIRFCVVPFRQIMALSANLHSVTLLNRLPFSSGEDVPLNKSPQMHYRFHKANDRVLTISSHTRYEIVLAGVFFFFFHAIYLYSHSSLFLHHTHTNGTKNSFSKIVFPRAHAGGSVHKYHRICKTLSEYLKRYGSKHIER